MNRFLRGAVWLALAVMATAPAVVMAQDDACSSFVRAAAATAQEECSRTGRNQACYGHQLLDVVPQSGYEGLQFKNQGDLVNVAQVERIRLSALDTQAGVWGIALMRLQASLAGDAPTDDVLLLLVGNIELENAENFTSRIPVTISAGNGVNVRLGPSTETAITAALSPNEEVIAKGRDETGEWLYIEVPNERVFGWVSRSLIAIEEADLNQLDVVDLTTPRYGPMQAFYLRTGEDEVCGGAPDNGLLVQTPDGVAEVRLWINDVRVRMLENATTYLHADAEAGMTVNVLEGIASVEAGDRTYPIVAGTEINIPMNARMQAVSVPRLPRPSSPVEVEAVSALQMHRQIVPADPFTEEQIQDFRARIDTGEDVCGAAPYPPCDSVETLESVDSSEDEGFLWTTGTGTIDEDVEAESAAVGDNSAAESAEPAQPPPEWVTTIVETIESMAPQIVPIIVVALVLAIITAIVLSLWRRQQG